MTEETTKPTPTEPIPIDLGDGQKRSLRFPIGAWRNLRKRFGDSLLIQMDEEQIFWVLLEGLRHKGAGGDPKLTEEDLNELITFGDAARLQEQVGEALKRSMPQRGPNDLAPFVPTDEELIRVMLTAADLKAGEQFVDVGCGDGRTLRIAAKEFNARARGYEMNPERAKLCRESFNGYFGEIQVKEENVLLADLSDADVVWLYLLADTNSKVEPLLRKMKPGSRVISHDYPMPGWLPIKQGSWEPQDGTPGQRQHLWFCYEIGRSCIVEPEKN